MSEQQINRRVAQALETHSLELKKQVESQKAQIEKLQTHNKCYRETIEYLESQLKHTTADLTKASETLAKSFSKSKGLQL